MIYLTFTHGRDIFNKNEFKNWIKIWFKTAKFEGCEYANWYPTISVSLIEFEKWKSFPGQCEKEKGKLVKIKGTFTIVQQLSSGVRDFENDLRLTNN